jgi:hypothetical protein
MGPHIARPNALCVLVDKTPPTDKSVEVQIAGSSASARALNSHCDIDPASIHKLAGRLPHLSAIRYTRWKLMDW